MARRFGQFDGPGRPRLLSVGRLLPETGFTRLARVLHRFRMDYPSTVVVIGPLPPPVHGAAWITSLMTEAMRNRCDLTVADTSPGKLERSLRYHATKAAKVLRAMAILALRARGKPRRLYMSADHGLGIYYNTALVIVARILRYAPFIHHHSFAYLDRRSNKMALLARCAGPKAVHIMLCPDMVRRYRELYPVTRCTMTVSNAWTVEPVEAVPERPGSDLILGHLSNLGPEKGLGEALEMLRRLIREGVAVRLVLAGPPMTAETANVIEAARTEFGLALEYRGPVYGADKDRFYRDIDVFLFPSHSEAQPIVLFEAMANGVPPIAYSRGCMASDLEGGGIAVPPDDDFVETALPILMSWHKCDDLILEARRRALARVRELRHVANGQFQGLIDTLTQPDDELDSIP